MFGSLGLLKRAAALACLGVGVRAALILGYLNLGFGV